MNNFGEIIKEHRLARGLTLKDIENKTGINNGNLSRWERNEVLPNIVACIQLAETYNISLNELLGIDSEFSTTGIKRESVRTATDEAELLELYRQLSPTLKGLTLQAVRQWAGKPTADNANKKA